MKKILLLIACVMASVGSVGAMEINSELILLDVPYSDEELDNMTKENDSFEIASDTKYIVTSYTTNYLGEIINENSIVTTKKNAEAVAKDDSLYVANDGTIKKQSLISPRYSWIGGDTIETESKEVTITYSYQKGDYIILLKANWTKLPKIRVFDILALRWTNNVAVFNEGGFQQTGAKTTNYSSSSKNFKRGTNAFGISMNLYNDAKEDLFLDITVSSKSKFGDIYGSYQHAKNSNATLAISQSYTFNSSGLGGVINFSNSTYKSYYDNTPGVKLIGK